MTGSNPRLEALQRVLRSKTFEAALSLRRLLEYLALRSIESASESPKEYTVGVEAFGKAGDYDPRADPSVRVQASKLREKLQFYYSHEGKDDPVQIDFPRGAFRVEFLPREKSLHTAKAPAASLSPTRMWQVVAAVLAFALVATLTLLIKRGGAGALAWPMNAKEARELDLIWHPFLHHDGRPVVLVVGNPLFVRFADGFYRNSRINEWSQVTGPNATEAPAFLKGPPLVPYYEYTGIGEAAGAVAISNVFAGRGVELLLQPSSTLSWEDVRRHDLIFVGAPKFNTQLNEIWQAHGFVIDGSRIRNVKPKPGEPAFFADRYADDRSSTLEGYALISRLPGIHGSGTMLILAASSTQAARSAAEFLTQPKYTSEVVRKLAMPNGSLPKYFEMVIWGRFKSLVPLEIRYVAHHEIVAK